MHVFLFTVQTGLPLVFVVVTSVVLIFAGFLTKVEQQAVIWLRVTGIFCALVGLFNYAEVWSSTRIPVFDYGAPLMALLALIVRPVLAFFIYSNHRVLTQSTGLKSLFILANTLIVFSLSPGIFIVLFFAAALQSS